MSGLGYDVNYAEARGDDEPCSYRLPHSFLKISNDPWKCEKVDYWVPEKCGIKAGLYKTDASCQPPPAPEAELTSVQSKPAEPESELPASSVSYIHTEPCSDTSPNSFLKISNDPLECEEVDYWVPRICGIEAGLYKTSAICQHHPAPEVAPFWEDIPWWAWPIIVIVCFIIVWGESNRRSREDSGPIWGYFYPKNSNFRDGPSFMPSRRWRDED